ncbi:MAG TPA: hypothetical protein PLU67_10910 [Candidatus Kapabacteria bacterium]|nr:hypothetical protein [Candidatus Kapabacteria bacterium]HPP38712.1 hypothetical protein [Candidatus Kapabacteria bacterium]
MRCKECYSELPRATPLKDAADCLKRHRQYVCSTCGRIVCIDLAGERRARCFMPFGSLEIAMLYLKAAEILTQGLCGIYELIYKRGDKRYRIFRNIEELNKFLKSNPEVKCEKKEPVYISEKYFPINDSQIKYLNESEIKTYLNEMKNR